MPRFEDLGLECEVVDDKVSVSVFGPPAVFFSDQIDRVVNAVNSLKVIARRNGTLVYNLYNPPQPTRAGFHALERNIKARIAGHELPATANIAITMGCQCECVHCSAERFRCAGKRELTADEIMSVVSQAVDMGCTLVIFTGGEPLLRKELFELIAHVDQDRAMPMIFTNGQYLNSENVQRLTEAGLYSMYISVDSCDPREHNRLRGVPGLFEMAIEGAHRAREAGILVGLSTYVTSERLADGKLEEIIKLAQREGFHETTIFDCMPSGKYLRRRDMLLSDEEKQKVAEIARRHYKSSHPMGVIAQAVVNSPAGVGCYGARSELYMTPFGDINPCDFNPVTFGNVLEAPLAEIWKKMVTHPDFCYRHQTCRMQTPSYLEKFIDILPEDVQLPVPIETVEAIWAEKGIPGRASGKVTHGSTTNAERLFPTKSFAHRRPPTAHCRPRG